MIIEVVNCYLGAGAAAGTFAVTQTALRTTTGNQDITISGFGTPKAVRFIANYATSSSNPASSASGSVGATDGTDQFVSGWFASDGITHSSNVYRRGATDAVIMVPDEDGNSDFEAAFVQWVTDGVRINVSAVAGGRAITITAEFYGGADLTAKVGTTALTTQNGTTTLTPGFQANAILFDSHVNPFNDTGSLAAIFSTGVASYDGSTIRQAMNEYRSDSVSTSATQGIVRDGAVFGLDTRYAELTSVSATQFVLTSRGADLSALSLGYLALNFGGAHQAWVGVLDSPTATGNHDFTGPSFTPKFVSMRPTMLSVVNSNDSAGQGSAFGISTITATAQYSNHWRDKDNVTGGNELAKSETATNAVTMSDHAGTAAFTASFDSFLSNGVRLNFSVANGTVRKWPFLFIG